MSEYSTDELMGEVQSHLDYGQHMIPTPVCSSIIARLRAADALISAVREESPLSVNVRKAIAEYEGKL